MDLEQSINVLIEPTMNDMGYELIRTQISGNSRVQLQIMAEPSDGSDMGIDDCVTLSRAISAVLDVEDPIRGEFVLEVSSPGIDRPLIKYEDYTRFDGHEARIETAMPIEGRKRFKGRICGAEDNIISIVASGEKITIPFNDILRAKLMLAEDFLLKAKKE